VELAITRGIKITALYRGLIKSVFLMYFHLYIFLNITLLPKLRFKTPGLFKYRFAVSQNGFTSILGESKQKT